MKRRFVQIEMPKPSIIDFCLRMEGKTGNIVVMREVPEGENVETKIRKSIDTRFERE